MNCIKLFKTTVHANAFKSREKVTKIVSLGFEPRSVSITKAFRELIPTIDSALLEIKEGSASQAEVILQTLKEVFE